MAYITLKREPIANVAPATGYTVQVFQYDTRARRLYRDSYQATTNTGANAPFELTVGQLVPGASFCYGSTLREVRYAGDGAVSTQDNPNAPACASGLTGVALTASGIADQPGGGNNTGTAYEQTQQLTATWSGAVGSLTVRCALLMPGSPDTQPYYEVRNVAAGDTTAAFPAVVGQPIGLSTSRREGARLTYVGSADGLGPGRYRVEVTEDATGYTAAQEINLAPTRAGNAAVVRLYGKSGTGGTVVVLTNGPLRVVLRQPSFVSPEEEIYVERQQPGDVLLRLTVEPLDSTQARIRARVYRNGAVLGGEVTLGPTSALSAPNIGDLLPAYDYSLPAGWPVGGTAAVPVVSAGLGNVQTLQYDPRLRLGLANLILLSPPNATAPTGGAIVEVATSYDTHGDQTLPLSYQLVNLATNTQVAANTTGRFDGLAAGAYQCFVYPLAAIGLVPPLQVPITLRADYGLCRTLAFSDLHNNTPCRLELHAAGYTGQPEALCGQASPITIQEEGIQGGDGQADLGPSVGKSMTMRLRAQPGELQAFLTNDRSCRADFYYNDQLQFTGFVEIGLQEEALLSGPVEVELTATCGLAGLKDLAFSGHVNQELRGRFRRLDTLLHCLSRTGLALPLTVAANLRAAELLTGESPEEMIYTDRLAYAALDLRAVVDALCQSLGGTLVQRNGQWMVLSALEAAQPAPARHYRPAGSSRQGLTIGAPTGRLVPERIAQADRAAGAGRAWYWLTKGNQRVQRRAGWRFYTGTADATFAENAFRQGEYFGDAAFWDASATVLQPETGWQAGPGGFPLALVEAGEKNTDLATLWPEAIDAADTRYLESELAPVETSREALPFELSVTAKYVAPTYETAWLWVEVVSVRGTTATDSFGALLAFKAAASLTDGFTTASALLPMGLLAGGQAPRVRVHAYTVTTTARRRVGSSPLLVQKVALQLRPQGAKWDGKTSFVASGAGGSVRPTSPLEVFHVDAPANAGLFLGTAAAFRHTLTRFANIPTTQWSRADDLRPAPMLASQVLDVLALRANPSRLLIGTVRHLGLPIELLDSLDAPYDIPGRRWAVGARAWHVKENETDITVLEIGEGENPPLLLPDHARILDGRPGGRLRVRGTHRGIRITS